MNKYIPEYIYINTLQGVLSQVYPGYKNSASKIKYIYFFKHYLKKHIFLNNIFFSENSKFLTNELYNPNIFQIDFSLKLNS